MNSKIIGTHDNTSTSKRRRLASEINNFSNLENNVILNESLIDVKNNDQVFSDADRCESPYIPCNQDEYLFVSRNTSSCSDMQKSTDALCNSAHKCAKTWESRAVSSNFYEYCSQDLNKEINEVSDDMSSKTNESTLRNQTHSIDLKPCHLRKEENDYLQNVLRQQNQIAESNASKLKESNNICQNYINYVNDNIQNQDINNAYSNKTYKDMVEDSFDLINQSICNFDINKHEIEASVLNNSYANFILEDEFKVDTLKEDNIALIKDGLISNIEWSHKSYDLPNINIKSCSTNEIDSKLSEHISNNFYGLPMAAKDLFKTYRNIEKFYDWQEECLNLDAIKERCNLVYALPTSGGKTLVAEVLMLREVLNRKKNALFILPYVAIVQEKIWALSPFAVKLEFLLEEYTGGKGPMPPKKRRKKNSIFIATIEKGLALVRSLIELKRLDEIGLIVVDELHLIGEKGRGGTLETLLSTIIFANNNIQIVGMSATIGNLDEVATFLRAEVYERHFRPVELTEYVKLGNQLHRITWEKGRMDLVPDRELSYNYTKLAASMDPDLLGGLVSEVVPEGSCLVFCPTKRNCENVVALLCKLQRKEMVMHRREEREALEKSLRAEGSNSELVRAVRFGIAYHHAGLASDERLLLENAFRSGFISVLCCTSTLAAGVNLPARRVLIRAPLLAARFLTLSAYRQMVGRAGRAGICQTGESIVICGVHEWERLQGVLSGGLDPATSCLGDSAGPLLLGAVALGLGRTRADMRRLLSCTFLAVAGNEDGPVDIDKVCDETIHWLVKSGGLEITEGQKESSEDAGSNLIPDDSVLCVSKLGRAAIKGCMELSSARQLQQDLELASRSLVLMGSLHLLYLVTPHDAAGIRPDCRHYYSLYCNLDAEALQTAKVLGINEGNAVRMMTGKAITNVTEMVLRRFYLALILHDLWNQMPLSAVSEKYLVPRGTAQGALQTSSSLASSAQRFSEELQPLWPFALLFGELAPRLRHCSTPDLHQLLELPAVKKARALQLMRAGYKRIEDIAKANPDHLVATITHLSRTGATQLVSAARLMLIEKVENLRAEAEDVIEELNL